MPIVVIILVILLIGIIRGIILNPSGFLTQFFLPLYGTVAPYLFGFLAVFAILGAFSVIQKRKSNEVVPEHGVRNCLIFSVIFAVLAYTGVIADNYYENNIVPMNEAAKAEKISENNGDNQKNAEDNNKTKESVDEKTVNPAEYKEFYNKIRSIENRYISMYDSTFTPVIQSYKNMQITKQKASDAIYGLSTACTQSSKDILAVRIPDSLPDKEKEKAKEAQKNSSFAADNMALACLEAQKVINSNDGGEKYARRHQKFMDDSNEKRVKAEMLYQEVADSLQINLKD